jgi:hypothetical protein
MRMGRNMTSVRSYVNYSRLVILSFAFHSGALKNQTPGQDVVMRVSVKGSDSTLGFSNNLLVS